MDFIFKLRYYDKNQPFKKIMFPRIFRPEPGFFTICFTKLDSLEIYSLLGDLANIFVKYVI